MARDYIADAFNLYLRWGLPGSAVGIVYAAVVGATTGLTFSPQVIGAYAALVAPTITGIMMAIHLWRKNSVEIAVSLQDKVQKEERHEKEMREKDLELQQKEEQRLAERDKRLNERQAGLLKQREEKAASEARIKEIEAKAQREWQEGHAGQLVTEKLAVLESKLDEAIAQRDSYEKEVKYTRQRNHDLGENVGILENKLALAEHEAKLRLEQMAIQAQQIEALTARLRAAESRIDNNVQNIEGIRSEMPATPARPGYTEE